MFCTNCGNNVPDGSVNCPVCGAALQAQQPQQPVYQQPDYQQPVAADDGSGSVLVFGILALVLSEIPIVGLIFSILAKNKSNAFAAAHGGTCYGKAKVGRILGTVGLIVSIICNAIYLISFIVGLAGGCNASSYYYYY